MLAALKLAQLLQEVLVKLHLRVAYKSMCMLHGMLEVCHPGLPYNPFKPLSEGDQIQRKV